MTFTQKQNLSPLGPLDTDLITKPKEMQDEKTKTRQGLDHNGRFLSPDGSVLNFTVLLIGRSLLLWTC